jgi:hypothetical protein
MSVKLKFLFSIFLLFLFSTSCKHKPNFSNLATVSYSENIQPIISSNCTQSGCHGLQNQEEFTLLKYSDVMKHTEVIAGSPEMSNLYHVIRTYNSEKVMPRPPYKPLSEKQIQLIYVWIGQGALNN